MAELGLSDEAATTLAFDAELGEYFERAVAAGDGVPAEAIANWVTGELVAALRQAGAEEDPLASKVDARGRSPRWSAWSRTRRSPTAPASRCWRSWSPRAAIRRQIVEREGLGQISDSGELEAIVERAIEAEPEAAEQVRGGNEKAIGAIVGAVMKETKGRADGGEVTKLIKERL